MKIIGLSGKKCVGKDTVADIIINSTANSCKIGFADALYREVATMMLQADNFKINEESIEDKITYIKNNKSHFRTLLQWWGTDYRRKFFGDNYWIEKCIDKIKLLPSESLVVVPDVRFINEFEAIKKLGGTVWRIYRPHSPNETDNHSSETELSSYINYFDETIINNGTLQDLEQRVMLFLKQENL